MPLLPQADESTPIFRRSSTSQIHDDDNHDDLAQPKHASRPQSPDKSSKLTFLDAFALLVSLQIGSGVFSSPSQVDRHARAPGFALLLWLASGLLAWTGATCYAELGVALPFNGGMQEYLRYIYGDGPAFMVAWIWVTAVKPSSMAVLSITAAQYWVMLVGGGELRPDGWISKVVALSGFYIVVALNMVSVDATTKMMKFFLGVKISTLALLLVFTLLFLVFGLHLGDGPSSTDWCQRNWFGSTHDDWIPGMGSAVGQSTVAIYAGLWAFSGWDNANMVAGDMRSPSRDLPRALHSAQPLVISSFLLANLCYYITVPWDSIDESNTIAVTVGNNIGGWIGGLAFTVLVSLACLGSVNVNVFTASRLVVSAAQANWLPRFLEDYSSVFSPTTSDGRPSASSRLALSSSPTPIRAMLFSAVITTVYIYFGTFGSLVTFIGLSEFSFFCITVCGLLILRKREPELPRPYKPSIVIPIIFVVGSSCLTLFGSIQAPIQASCLVALIVVGYLRIYTMQRGGFLKAMSGLCSRKRPEEYRPAPNDEGRV